MTTNSSSQAELPDKWQRAIAALLVAGSIKAAAKRANVGERTLHTWLQDDTFKGALRRAQDEAIDTAVSRLAGAATEAANVLATIAGDETEKGSTRVQAARAVLDNALKLAEHRDLVKRIEELEKRI